MSAIAFDGFYYLHGQAGSSRALDTDDLIAWLGKMSCSCTLVGKIDEKNGSVTFFRSNSVNRKDRILFIVT